MKECKVCAYPGKKAVRSIAAKTLANDAINIWVFWNNIKMPNVSGAKSIYVLNRYPRVSSSNRSFS